MNKLFDHGKTVSPNQVIFTQMSVYSTGVRKVDSSGQAF